MVWFPQGLSREGGKSYVFSSEVMYFVFQFLLCKCTACKCLISSNFLPVGTFKSKFKLYRFTRSFPGKWLFLLGLLDSHISGRFCGEEKWYWNCQRKNLIFLIYLMWILAVIGLPLWLSYKESACNAGDLGSVPGLGISLGGGLATHSSILAWRIPTEEPGGLQSTGSQSQTWQSD